MGYFKKLQEQLDEQKLKGSAMPDQKRHYIESKDIGVEYADRGPWRSYELTAEGNGVGELFADASVSEIDQDGGELSTYALTEADNEVIFKAIEVLEMITGQKLCDNEDGDGGCAGDGSTTVELYEKLGGECAECHELRGSDREPCLATPEPLDDDLTQTETYLEIK